MAYGVFLLGCANKSLTRFEKIAPEFEKSNFAASAALIKANPKLYGENTRFLYDMDLGVLYHYMGKYDSSNIYLTQAAQTLDDLYAKSVTNEAGSILLNDNVRPYRSRPYEIVMLHQYMALNYMAVGKLDEALVETRSTQLIFEAWQRKEGKTKKYVDDGMFHYLSSIAYEGIGQRDNALISLYQSVKAYQQGPFPLPKEVQQTGYYRLKNNGRQSDVELLKLQPVSGLEEPAPLGSAEIILVGYAGHGPVLQDNVFWGTYEADGVLVFHYHNAKGDTITQVLPAPGLPASEMNKVSQGRRNSSGTTLHIKFAMPAVKILPSQTEGFSVSVDGVIKKSFALTNLDKLVEQSLEDDKTSTLIRTVIRVALRTYAAQKTKDQLVGSNPLLNLLFSVGTDVLADQLEQADTRASFMLPKTLQLARFPVSPGKHKITVSTNSSSLIENVELEVHSGEKRFMIVPSLR